MPKGNRAGRDKALKRMQREYYWREEFDPREFADPRIVQPPGFYHPVPGNCQDPPPPPPLPARPVPTVLEIASVTGQFLSTRDFLWKIFNKRTS
ncbi:hypothetical protein ALC57_03020 [Trachymyrmex cornetzi]|uniref:Uncharacterized protein n=1 Tax=Trachymyrmex cornetzi TaxID=471704 RepID=A0A151JMS4_9HYME|nr:hypothetical protein ALC57_03020 [Trachymyrmex cornetzi]